MTSPGKPCLWNPSIVSYAPVLLLLLAFACGGGGGGTSGAAGTGAGPTGQVAAAPRITGIHPGTARAGQDITFLGTDFHEVTEVVFPAATHHASAGGEVVSTRTFRLEANGTRLTVTVPPGAGTGAPGLRRGAEAPVFAPQTEPNGRVRNQPGNPKSVLPNQVLEGELINPADYTPVDPRVGPRLADFLIMGFPEGNEYFLPPLATDGATDYRLTRAFWLYMLRKYNYIVPW